MYASFNTSRGRTTVAVMLVGLVLLTAVPAIVQGVLTRRWHGAADLAGGAKRLVDFPTQFGDWQQQGEEDPVPEDAIRELQCAGCFNRHYVNQRLGRDVTVIVMVGPAGPLIRHPPEICYGNRANQLLSKAIRGNYPFDIDSLPAVASVQALIMFGGPRQFNSASEIISTVEPMIVELEGKLSACVAKIQSS